MRHLFIFLGCLSLAAVRSGAATYYVATTGNDINNGTDINSPFKTIQKAADLMRAGDEVVIRGGDYREKIVPPRGGGSEVARITYKAYPGERPVIKGSEIVKGWIDQGNGVWKVELPDSFFNASRYNPFATVAKGVCLGNPEQWHLGLVYLNGEAYSEAKTLESCQKSAKTFFALCGNGMTAVYAHFDSDPHKGLVEVNVRESCFQPEIAALGYITLSGLTLMQASPQWSSNVGDQWGVITAKVAYHWIIEHCRVSDTPTMGIALANINGSTKKAYNEYGFNTVRYNTIERCGEGGICGHKVPHASLIEGNLIQDIGWQRKFSGAEQAGIKFHWAIDVVIKNNIIRRIFPKNVETICCLWLDWANQGARITGNILYDEFSIGGANHLLLLEANCGPIFLDHNIIIGTTGFHNTCALQSTAVVFAHNLIFDTRITHYNSFRKDPWLTPHTLTIAGVHDQKKPPVHQVNRNNIYVKSATDVDGGNNVFYSGIQNFSHADLANGITITFVADHQPSEVKAPLISNALIGRFQPMDQGMEKGDGSSFDLDQDIDGKSRTAEALTAGPVANIKVGVNCYTFTAGANAKR